MRPGEVVVHEVERYGRNVVLDLPGEGIGTNSPIPPLLVSNDSFGSGASGFGGTCAGAGGTNGNTSVDPLFVSTHNYHLQSGSPSIDAGDDGAPDLPSNDIDGDPRIVGNAIDQGFDEVA